MKQVSYALVSLVISAFILFYLVPYHIGEVSLNKANPLQSPAVVPYLFAGLAVVVSLLMLGHSAYKVFVLKQQQESVEKPPLDINYKRFIVALIAGAVLLVLLPLAGVEVAVVAFIVGTLIAVGERKPLIYVELIVIGIAIAEFFIYVVNVPLPTTIEVIGGLL